MHPANISRAEARTRSSIISVESYQVDVDLTGHLPDGSPLPAAEENFVSTTTVRFSSTGEPTWIDLIADDLLSVTLDDTPLDTADFGLHRFPFETDAGQHTLTLTAICRYSRTGEGLHRFVDPADGRTYLYSQFETADARRMYACFEQPDIKGRFELTVTAPEGWVVTSNARPTSPELLAEGVAIWRFDPTPPIPTYITALVAGDYYVHPYQLRSTAGVLPATVMCRQSMAQFLDATRIITTTQDGFEIFEEAFGRAYPFDSYDQVFVPEFNAGAMENAGCVTFRDEYIFRSRVTAASYESRDNTILHELAHMWFGNLVTMRWWDDLWLNESFAEWASHYCQARIVTKRGGSDPWVAFCNERKNWAYRQDQLPTTHPVAADMVDLEAVEQNFDGITYAKGASVLKQLVAFVGEDAFLAGVREYFQAHAFANTELSDLLHALQVASSRDLSSFVSDWLATSGVNTVSADFQRDEQGRFSRFDVVQTAPPGYPTLRTHRLAIGLYDVDDGSLLRRDSLEVDIRGDRTPIAALVGQAQPDLVLLNDRDLTYAKVLLDDRSLAFVLDQLELVTDPLARAIIWGTLWAMCRDAVLPSKDFVAAGLAGLANEPDLTAVRTVLGQLRTAVSAYTAAENRAGAASRLMAGLARLLKQANPGSDHQLAFGDALVAVASSPIGQELIQGWLVDEQVPPGLSIDSDRRWGIITSLARSGAIDASRINAELQRDQTISGAEFAAGARSALADVHTKADAWRLATEQPDIPNGIHHAVCANFWNYQQAELLVPYRRRYLDLCRQIADPQGPWADRGHITAQTALLWLYPAPLADEEFLTQLDDLLADDTLGEQVLRVVRERRDDSQRALACQQLDRRSHSDIE